MAERVLFQDVIPDDVPGSLSDLARCRTWPARVWAHWPFRTPFNPFVVERCVGGIVRLT